MDILINKFMLFMANQAICGLHILFVTHSIFCKAVPESGFSENTLPVFPDKTLNASSELSASSALTRSTVVPTTVDSLREMEYVPLVKDGALVFRSTMCIVTRATCSCKPSDARTVTLTISEVTEESGESSRRAPVSRLMAITFGAVADVTL